MKNLTQCEAFGRLLSLKNTPTTLSSDTIMSQVIRGPLLSFSYAGAHLSPEILSAFQALSEEQQVLSQWAAMNGGQIVNHSENRAAKHLQTRAKNRGDYGAEQLRFSTFAMGCRNGVLVSGNQKPFKWIVQIGIGGSHLGPEALYQGLHRWVRSTQTTILETFFLANIDPDDWADIADKINIEETLFIVVSKSGSTHETAANFEVIQTAFQNIGWSSAQCRQNCVAVTLKKSKLDDPTIFREIFYIDEEIGGRFSATSAVGGVVLSIAFGPETFESLLQGAAQMDENAAETSAQKNLSLMAALISIWECNVQKFSASAVIPYSQALAYFPAHLQQLECESNGKRVSKVQEVLDYPTSPVIFGEPGTQCQHSFFQKIHQGTEPVPIQFIGFLEPQLGHNEENSAALLANLVAQMVALSTGKPHTNPNQAFPGNRPYSVLFGRKLTPEALGALLAFYENKVAFESFLWNINAFDQEGVQLGKVLAKDFVEKSGEHGQLLKAYETLLTEKC